MLNDRDKRFISDTIKIMTKSAKHPITDVKFEVEDDIDIVRMENVEFDTTRLCDRILRASYGITKDMYTNISVPQLAEDIAESWNKYNGGGRVTGATSYRGIYDEFLSSRRAAFESGEQIRFEKYTGSMMIPRTISIVDVKFNEPATIVFWSDNTKTVVKCDPTDNFDPEKGLAMAIAKKFLGNNTGKYYDIFKKHTPTGCWMKEEKDTNAIRVSCCADCAYSNLLLTEAPCYYCRNWSNFVQKVEVKGEEKRVYSCPDCVYSNCSYSQEPCYSCRNRSHFVQKGEKKE